MSIYKKLREATRKIQKRAKKTKFVIRPMSSQDLEKGEEVRTGKRMSDEEYEALGGDRPDLDEK